MGRYVWIYISIDSMLIMLGFAILLCQPGVLVLQGLWISHVQNICSIHGTYGLLRFLTLCSYHGISAASIWLTLAGFTKESWASKFAMRPDQKQACAITEQTSASVPEGYTDGSVRIEMRSMH
jgi:hypothetical protein